MNKKKMVLIFTIMYSSLVLAEEKVAKTFMSTEQWTLLLNTMTLWLREFGTNFVLLLVSIGMYFFYVKKSYKELTKSNNDVKELTKSMREDVTRINVCHSEMKTDLDNLKYASVKTGGIATANSLAIERLEDKVTEDHRIQTDRFSTDMATILSEIITARNKLADVSEDIGSLSSAINYELIILKNDINTKIAASAFDIISKYKLNEEAVQDVVNVVTELYKGNGRLFEEIKNEVTNKYDAVYVVVDNIKSIIKSHKEDTKNEIELLLKTITMTNTIIKR